LVEAITNTNTSSTTANQLIDADLDTKIQVEESSDEDKIRFDVAGSEKMVLDSTGLGIGTDSPSDLLHIKSTSSDAEITLQSTNSGGDARLRMIANSSGLSSLQFQDENDSNVGFVNYEHSSNSMHFRTNDVERMRIDSSGNVGIGVAAPSTSLDIVRAGVQPLRLESSSGTEVAINMVNTGGNVQLEAHSGNFNIDADAVGIGTASPGVALDVNGGSNTQLRLTASDSTGGSIINFGDQDNVAVGRIVYSHVNNSFSFKTNNVNDRLVIDSSGHVNMPNQPAFNAYAGTAQANLSNGTVLIFDTERFDIGSNYNTSDGHFTAPVNGKYQLSVNVRLDNIDNASNYIYIQLVTSNSSYYVIYDHGGTDAAYFSYSLSVLADMDASDTAYVSFHQSGGSNTADFVVAGANRFTGVLVC